MPDRGEWANEALCMIADEETVPVVPEGADSTVLDGTDSAG